jgi:hypothetical protein
MSSVEKLLKAINLQVEENKTITEVESGIKTTVICNKKHMMTGITNVAQLSIRNRSQAIIFNTHSKSKDCSYLVLEKCIHKALSSKISFVVSKLLHLLQTPELYNQVKSQEVKQLLLKFVEKELINFDSGTENNLADKWSKIIDKVSEKSIQDVLVSLIHKVDCICVEDEKMIQLHRKAERIVDNEKCSFAYWVPYMAVEFPLYSADTSKNKLLGEPIEKSEVEGLKMIYQYIFKDIDKKNAYSSLENTLLQDKPKQDGDKVYIVDRIHDVATPTMMLIETFNSLATHIDGVLDSISDLDETIENEKFNLNLTQEEMDELKSLNTFAPNYNNYGSIQDYASELKSSPKVNFDDFNKQLNEASAKSNPKGTVSQPKESKRRTFIGSGGALFGSLSLPATQMIDSFNVLDPDDKSFETKIPNKERKRHTYILAGSGSGKTSLLETLLKADCKKLDHSIIIFDIMGKATNSVLKFVKDPSRIVLIDPFLHGSITPIINPFELESKDELSIANRTNAIINATDIALALKDGWSTNMRAMLAPCTSTLLRKGGADIYELQRGMNDEQNKLLVKLGKESPVKGHANFFDKEFYKESYEVTKNAISAKLQVFVNDPTLASLITGESTINLKREINTAGKIIIFKLPPSQKIFARLMIELVQDIMRQRANLPEDKIVPTHIYLDEFQNYITSTIEEVLAESRNYGCYVTFAHQTIGQLSRKIQSIVMSNSNIKIIGQCSYEDGRKMAKEMKAEHKTIQALTQGEFLFKIGSRDVAQWKNTDKFINDKTPVQTKQRAKHMKYQYKHFYAYKEKFSLQSSNDVASATEKPKYDEF